MFSFLLVEVRSHELFFALTGFGIMILPVLARVIGMSHCSQPTIVISLAKRKLRLRKKSMFFFFLSPSSSK
jgi:hypothetical protein